MHLKSIRQATRLQLWILLFSLLVISSLSIWAIEKTRINGPLYQDISESKQLLADILPPPLFLVEPFLTATQLAAAKKAEVPELQKKLEAQITEYRRTLEVWRSVHLPDELHEELFERSLPPAILFIEVIESRLIPAIHASDKQQIQAASEELNGLFYKHRSSISRLATLAKQYALDIEKKSENDLLNEVILLFLSVSITIGLSILLSRYLGLMITTKVGYAVSVANAVANGTLDKEILAGQDVVEGEIGEILVSLENMRKALLANLHQVETQKSELIHQSEQLEDAKVRLEASERLKSEFIANMTHELKTPLNGILGMIQLLAINPVDDEQLEYIQVAERSAKGLFTLIDDMLFYARIETDPEKINKVPFGVLEMVQAIADKFSIRAREKGLGLELHVADTSPEVILGEPEYLSRLLGALVDNAVKFTSSGSVSISLTTLMGRDSELLQFSIKDSGPGLPAGKGDDLFGLFTQKDGSAVRKHGGTGLGLALANSLSKSMNGKLEASSLPEGGALFQLTIPFERDIEIV